MRPRLAAALVAGAGVAGVGIGAVLALAPSRPAAIEAAPALHAQATWPSGDRRAPAFRLRDQTGRLVTLRSERGHVVLLTFLDSRCKQECPIQGRLMASVERSLGAGVRPAIVVVTADPWADTARSVRAFAARARWVGPWHWLLGTPRQVRPVWTAYHVGVLRTPTDVNHTAVVYLIDGDGYQRAAYLVPFSPADVAADVQGLASS